MASGALMNQKQQPLYFPLLDSPISPSIRNLQVLIEAAWTEGKFRFITFLNAILYNGFDKGLTRREAKS
jgi:hypothetical protein